MMPSVKVLVGNPTALHVTVRNRVIFEIGLQKKAPLLFARKILFVMFSIFIKTKYFFVVYMRYTTL